MNLTNKLIIKIIEFCKLIKIILKNISLSKILIKIMVCNQRKKFLFLIIKIQILSKILLIKINNNEILKIIIKDYHKLQQNNLI